MTDPVNTAAQSAAPLTEAVQQAVEKTVDYYNQSWLLYIALAVIFLVIAHILMRRFYAWIRIPLWSLMAAGALTPAASVSDQPFLAPAVLVALLGGETEGISGFMRGAVPIVIVFVLVLIVLTALHFFLRWRYPPTTGNPELPVVSAAPDDYEHADAPAHTEPRM